MTFLIGIRIQERSKRKTHSITVNITFMVGDNLKQDYKRPRSFVHSSNTSPEKCNEETFKVI